MNMNTRNQCKTPQPKREEVLVGLQEKNSCSRPWPFRVDIISTEAGSTRSKTHVNRQRLRQIRGRVVSKTISSDSNIYFSRSNMKMNTRNLCKPRNQTVKRYLWDCKRC